MGSPIIVSFDPVNTSVWMIFHTVTERVYEVVSTDASTDEEEKPVKTEVHIKTEKHSPLKQTKQTSLTSFFKR
jgi:hypothetical protein